MENNKVSNMVDNNSNSNISIMSRSFQLFLQFRRLLLWISKIFFCFIVSYYILNFNVFSFSFNVPPALRAFSFINTPLTLLENIGMGFLILPLAVVILSMFYSASFKLQIIANFIAISGNIFSIMHLLNKGLLEEYFRTFLITIYNKPSLETKVKLFADFFNQQINLYINSVQNIQDFQTFVQSQYSNNFPSYLNMLKTLSQLDIMSFASRVAEQLFSAYNQTLISLTTKHPEVIVSSSSWGTKTIYIGGCILVIAVSIYTLYKTNQNAVYLKETLESIVDMGKRITKMIRNALGTDKVVETVNTNINTVATQVGYVNANVDHMNDVYKGLVIVVNKNAEILTKALNELSQLAKNVTDLMQSKDTISSEVSNTLKVFNEDLMAMDNTIKNLAESGKDQNGIMQNILLKYANLQKEMQKALSRPTVEMTSSTAIDKTAVLADAADKRVLAPILG